MKWRKELGADSGGDPVDNGNQGDCFCISSEVIMNAFMGDVVLNELPVSEKRALYDRVTERLVMCGWRVTASGPANPGYLASRVPLRQLAEIIDDYGGRHADDLRGLIDEVHGYLVLKKRAGIEAARAALKGGAAQRVAER